MHALTAQIEQGIAQRSLRKISCYNMDVTRTTTRMAEPMADRFRNLSLIRTTVLLDVVRPWCRERRKFISNYAERRSAASPHIFCFVLDPSLSHLFHVLLFIFFFLSLHFNHKECFWSAALSTSMRDERWSCASFCEVSKGDGLQDQQTPGMNWSQTTFVFVEPEKWAIIFNSKI